MSAQAVAVSLGIVTLFGFGASCQQKATCAQQLKALGQAAILYSEANDGYLPPQMTFRLDAVEAKNEGAKWRANLIQYGAKPETFRCPNDDTFGLSNRMGIFGRDVAPDSSYGVALSLMDQPGLKNGLHINTAKVSNPSSFAYIEDLVFIESIGEEEGRAVTAHGEQMNRWFLDGHVVMTSTKAKK